ncbi:MAG: SMP-30/gluconolactonase/LRE family protein, partial [Gammaproteobacteria bacterium]|nr:SMP-30/gluconolactonase/LRE family protein [Gammaproteobacteria bacterium]
MTLFNLNIRATDNRPKLGWILATALCWGLAGCDNPPTTVESFATDETGSVSRKQADGQSTQLSGEVSDSLGAPLSNVTVRLQGGGIIGVATVFSNDAGQFTAPLTGENINLAEVEITARKMGYETSTVTGGSEVNLILPAGNLADEVPASAWVAHWPDSTARQEIMLNCVACHQFPDERIKHTAAAFSGLSEPQREQAWRGIFSMMRNIFPAIFPADPDAKIAAIDAGTMEKKEALVEMFMDPYTSLLDTHVENVSAPFLAKYMPADFSQIDSYNEGAEWGVNDRTLWREFAVSGNSLIREGAAAHGRFWAVDYRQHQMVELDPSTGEQTRHSYPQEGPAGPHTINRDADGNLWSTLMVNDSIARYDPQLDKWQHYLTPRSGEALAHDMSLDYRHEVVRDRKGRIWLSLIGLNKIGSYNPDSGEYHEYDAPDVEGVSDFQTSLYTVVMTSDKKYLWFSQLNGGVGSYNLETEAFEHYRWYPHGAGPHRLSISKDDVIWVPLTGSGQLLAIDGHNGKEIGRYDLPDPNSSPYSCTYDAKRNAVWVGTTNSDRWYRFDIASESFTIYPLPRKNTFFRAIDVDYDTGLLWSAYSHYVGADRGEYYMVSLDP